MPVHTCLQHAGESNEGRLSLQLLSTCYMQTGTPGALYRLDTAKKLAGWTLLATVTPVYTAREQGREEVTHLHRSELHPWVAELGNPHAL